MVLSLLMISCGGRQVSEEELLRSINTTPMLYTVQCVAQTTVIERSSRAMDWLGQRTAIIPVEANIKAGIDLSQLKNIRISGKTVYITLPDPVIEIESKGELHIGVALSPTVMIHSTYNRGVCVHPIKMFKVRGIYGLTI